ncbi:helix-turn-helix transcriptional regulator [Dermabacteraceae bacterium TAE3-ERU5]|nr:helix-turn-helix transcriptional regulator [Dermabacteraceae bacterium TAE3-ERU5]
MSEHDETFGQYLSRVRKNRELTLRALAEQLDLAISYISDIEKDRRYPPEKKLDNMAKVLRLSPEEMNEFFDLAAEQRENGVAVDLSGYIKETEQARVALRVARDRNLSDQGWQKVINLIEAEGGDN